VAFPKSFWGIGFPGNVSLATTVFSDAPAAYCPFATGVPCTTEALLPQFAIAQASTPSCVAGDDAPGDLRKGLKVEPIRHCQRTILKGRSTHWAEMTGPFRGLY
jgi:hypothetical protein